MSTENSEMLNESIERQVRTSRSRLETALTMGLVATGVVAAAVAADYAFDIRGMVNGIIERNKPAQEMLELYENTEVAIIPFEMDTQDAIELGDKIENAFNDITDGTITIDVTVVEPSESALEKYFEVNDDNCIDKNNALSYGSYIAASEMPELLAYDKLLALNGDPACQPGVMGVALVSDRYSEVFQTDATWEQLEQNGGEQEIRQENENGTASTTYMYSPVSTGVHELLHLYGLGHSGVLSTPEEYDGESLNLQMYSTKLQYVGYDIHAAVARQEYNEYGGLDIMGSGILAFTPELSVVEKYLLDWPNRQLGNEREVTTYEVGESLLEFNKETPATSIALFPFESAIPVRGIENEHMMDTIAFVPVFDEENSETLTGLDAYLLGDGNNFIELGRITNIAESDITYSLTLDHQKILIELDYTNNRIHVAAESH